MDPDGDRGVALAGDPPSGAQREDSGRERGRHLIGAGRAERAGPPALVPASEILPNGDHSWTGRTIGNYRVSHEIGRGGMGVVLLAVRDDDQFKKSVAIKLLRRGMDTEDILRRFRNERQILA